MMTNFEWAMIILTGVGVLLTAGGILVAVTRGVEKIRLDTSERIAAEAAAREDAIAEESKARGDDFTKLRQDLADDFKTHDHYVGETISALRRFIESVEGHLREVELWNRDHFVQKPDFNAAIDRISSDMRDGFAGIKIDLAATRKELKDDIAKKV